MYEYIFWVLAFVSALGLLVLSTKLIIDAFKKKKSVRPSRGVYSYQQPANPTVDASIESRFQNQKDTIDELQSHLLNLTSLLENLLQEIQGFRQDQRQGFNQLVKIVQSQAPSQNQSSGHYSQEDAKVLNVNQDIGESYQAPESNTSEQIPAVLKTFCELYNAGKSKNKDFQNCYHFKARIGDTSQIKSHIFEESTSGKLMVYYISENDFYAVVPFFGTTLDELTYIHGRFSEVFHCLEFDSQYIYKCKVILPARFELGSIKQEWILKEKGILELEMISPLSS